VRVAALYDIHGNLPALEAVLAELEGEHVDAYVIGGDTAAGPLPAETLDRVLALGDRAHIIRGNGDRLTREATEAASLSREQIEFLTGLPLTVTLDVDGLGPTLFCHATPRSDEEIFSERDSDELVAEMLAGTAEATVVCGHTHLQVDRRVGRWRIVNAGSVGFPNDAAGAHWAMLGPDVELRQVDYDRRAAYDGFKQTRWYASDRGSFLVENLLKPPTRSEALDFFDTYAARQRGA
jgi:predicted phosphodiesterase